MDFQLPIQAGKDDPEFVAILSRLLEEAVAAVRPKQVFLSHVDHWFGERWFGFQGKLLGSAGMRRKLDDARLSLPPFVPERIMFEQCYDRYEPTADFSPLSIHQTGQANLQRRIDRFTKNGVLLWYSGNTMTQEFGSAMLYVHTPDQCDGWYMCLRKEAGSWCFHKGIGITKHEIENARVA